MTDTTGRVSPLVRARWACPECRNPGLQEKPEEASCPRCGRSYSIHQGIPLLIAGGAPPAAKPSAPFDLSIVILTLNEKENVAVLLESLKASAPGVKSQFIVVDGGSVDGTRETARKAGALVINQRERGYGRALADGLAAAQGRYVITMDADLSHPADYIRNLWEARSEGTIIIASRYVGGSRFEAPWARKVLSRILNLLFSRLLSLPAKDISSGYRLYHRDVLQDIEITGIHFEALEEILIKIHMNGWKIREIPFHYKPRETGRSKARLISFGLRLLRTLFQMWALRSSIASADYDERAYSSRIPLQRYWQRARHRIIMGWADRSIGVWLDVGCGSSRIFSELENAVGVDVLVNKLRYLKKTREHVAGASVFALPFCDGSFDGAICSQVIEHIPSGDGPFRELARVLKPGGRLIIGTPDYGKVWWPAIEWMYKKVHPNGYADEHITHYSLSTLTEHLERAGFSVIGHRYILKAELNVLAKRL